MERRQISSGSPYEPIGGYCRALVVGRHVHVSGTAPIRADGSPPPEGSYEQAHLCLAIIVDALAQAGAGAEQVVRTRMYISSPEHWDDVARAHGEIFASIRPASTCVVAGLLDPRWFVEIEADAILDS
jgi:enamine deaminase RidA (YjgF/YER057c/UK114 family)